MQARNDLTTSSRGGARAGADSGADLLGAAVDSLRGRRVLVVGLGRFGGGVGVTRWLVSQGATVTVTDQAGPETLRDSLEAISDTGVRLALGGHDVDLIGQADLVVINPAVEKTKSAYFQEIARQGVAWTTEMNLFCERCPADVIGVTGSFGKSTTCAMLASVLEAARRAGDIPAPRIHLGGNIGKSLLPELSYIGRDDLVVLEMSNAQLEDLPRIAWSPRVAVIANLHPHHLDRHGSFEGYVRAKLNIAAATPGGELIIGEIHEDARDWVTELRNQTTRVVTAVTAAEPSVGLRVPGRHNQVNASCVLTVARRLGLAERVVREALAGFGGLPHRLEFVRSIDGVDYVNDSKSTAPAATRIAIESIEQPIVALVGGLSKPEVKLDELAALLAMRCRAVVCFGEAGPRFERAVREAVQVSAGGSAPAIQLAAKVDEAVRHARREARRGEVVLFSPGAPSFDEFENFERRGARFVQAVEGLII